MAEKLVSVIIPCFNSAQFLKEAIDSVVTQTYKDIELICIDDGSTDGTREILEEYVNKLSYMRILEHQGRRNRGQGASFNLGLNACNGELVAFLDSDDIWLPRKVEIQVEMFLKKRDVDLVYANGYKIDEKRRKLYPFLPEDHQETNNPEALLLNSYIAPSCAMIRKQLIQKIGMFDEGLLTSDHDFFVRASERSKLAYIPSKVWCYRKHEGQASKNYRTRYDTLKTVQKAKARYNYSWRVCCKRLAVCHYYIGESLFDMGKYASSLYHFALAGIYDPVRSFSMILSNSRDFFSNLWHRLCL